MLNGISISGTEDLKNNNSLLESEDLNNNQHDEENDEFIATQEHLDHLEKLENEIASLQECVELSEANAEAAQMELGKICKQTADNL